MRERLRDQFHTASTLQEVEELLLPILRAVREEGSERLGYVSGIITSDGQEHVLGNLRRLTEWTENLKTIHSFPLFSPSDIFFDVLLHRVHTNGSGPKEFVRFWRNVLASGQVTDIFMTPRWKESTGANDEHETATTLKLSIHYL